MADAPRRDDQPPAPDAMEPAPPSQPPPVAPALDRFGFAALSRHAGLGRWIAMNALLRDRERTAPPADAAPEPRRRRWRSRRPDVEGHAQPA